jgi:cytochrome P450
MKKPSEQPQKPSQPTTHTSARDDALEELEGRVKAASDRMREQMRSLIKERAKKKKAGKNYSSVQAKIREGKSLINNIYNINKHYKE